MFPLNDTEPNRYSFFPVMTIFLIVLNSVIEFSKPLYLPQGTFQEYWTFLMRYAFTPKLILAAQGSGMLSSITSMFMHADFFHLLGNMWALWVFGRRVEDVCGSVRFLIFYLLAGIGADILMAVTQSDSPIPGLGASGAIFGVMGAYLLLYPGGRIRTLVFLWFVPTWPRIRAGWVVLYFVGIQIIPALTTLFTGAHYSTAHWAHLGGFFFSIFIFLFLRPEAFARYLSDTEV
ncbi:MAG: rhomboid family intramembrane serine protease [Anaerolineales bacterium]